MKKDKKSTSIPNQYFQFLGDSHLYEVPLGSSIGEWLKEVKVNQEEKEDLQSGESKISATEEDSKQKLDLNKLEKKLDEALSKETEESLRSWLKGK